MPVPPWARNDEELFHELREAVVERRNVADRMREAAKAAFTWRTVDVELELLSLSYDSSIDDAPLVRTATTSAPRTLIFAGDTLMVEVEVGTSVLMGQMVPAQPCHVSVLTAQGWFGEAESDDAGFFLLSRPSPGPIRLQCRGDDKNLITDWVTI
jgi:hypothetical protein